MSPLELAQKYMQIYFSDRSMEELRDFFAEDLQFTGPFYQFNTANEYLLSFQSDSAREMKYELLAAYENENSACLVYQFSKSNISTPMAQKFEVNNGKIQKILLIFDSGAF